MLSAAALVVANMIGTGIFTTSGFLLTDSRSRESCWPPELRAAFFSA